MSDVILDRPPTDDAAPPSSSTAPLRRRNVLTSRLVATLVGASALLAWVLAAHPMWFDEMQAWNIARTSGSLADLVTNLRYEGHPAAWYVLLYGLTRVSGDPRAMQVLEFAIVVTSFALVLFRSPFPYLYRVGLVASYFVFFEYGAISRSYSLAVLLLVALVCALDRDEPRWTLVTVLSCALAFTVLSAAVLALAVAGAVLLARPSQRRRQVYAAITTLAVGLAAVSCIPPSDFRTFAQGLGNSSQFGSGAAVRMLSSIAGFWRSVVPLPAGSGAWNTNVLDGSSIALLLQAAAGIALFVVVLRALAGAPTARRLWCIGSLGCVLFSLVVILPERARYAGTAFLLLIACAWLAWRPGAPRRSLAAVFGVVLVIQVVATVALLPIGASSRFSPDRDLADVIDREAPGAPIVSGADFDALTSAGFLDQRVFSVARNAWTTYFVHDERQARGEEHLTLRKVECAAAELAAQRGRPVVMFADIEAPRAGLRRIAAARGVGVYVVPPTIGVRASC